jgi:hypothetical protein
MKIPDPRIWREPPTDSRLHALASASLAGSAVSRAELRLELDALFDAGDDDKLRSILRELPSAVCYRHVNDMMAKLINKPARGESVIARLFAIPLVLVSGAKSRAVVSGALPDVAAVSAVLDTHGALGAARNFGLGNALCTIETLEKLSPCALRQWTTELRHEESQRGLVGSAIEVAPGREQVLLRFLVGASVAPAFSPAITETAANIGAWGMPLTKLLAQQLAQPGLDLLPIPRPPAQLYLAADVGRAAQIELSFSLFLSNSLRQFRMAVGDPTAIISAHHLDDDAAELRVSLSSAFDESLLEGFRWPLYPVDEISEIVNKINNLLNECKVSDVRQVETIEDEKTPRGGWFIRVQDAQALTH